MKWKTKLFIILTIIFCFLHSGEGYTKYTELKHRNFLIRYNLSDENRALQVVKILQKTDPEIQDFYGIDFQGRVTVILAGSAAEFNRLAFQKLPSWSAAVFLPEPMRIVIREPTFIHTTDQLQTEIEHELSHLYFSRRFSNENIPLWFNEGLAEYLSGEEIDLHRGVIIANALFAKKIIPLTSVDSLLSFSPGKAQLAYAQSLSSVLYLKDLLNNSGSNWQEFLTAIEENGFPSALNRNLKIDSIDFEVKWYQWLKHKYQWFIVFNLENLIWFGLAVILIGALYAVRYRNRKILKQWEDEEQMQSYILLNDVPDESLISNEEDK
jgi:hypothetical protein